MNKFKIINLFILTFVMNINILVGDIDTKKVPAADAEEYLRNGKYYTKEGNIYYTGKCDTWSEKLTIFFKREAVCNPYFKITYCLENENAKCIGGITLCYNSYLIKYKKLKDEKMKKIDEIKCENPTDFGIHVSTEQSWNGKPEFFMLKSSLDKHFYRFKITEPVSANDPRRCFELRVGSKDSIATTITNLDGQKLIFVGDPPKEFKPDNPLTFFYPDDRDTMNLWMLFMDFMPYYPSSSAFMPRPIHLKGSNGCEMNLEFDYENINVCKQNREYIGGCETEYLNSSDLDCQVELQVSESVEKETADEKTITDSKGGSNSLEHGFDAGIEGKYTWGFNTGIMKEELEVTLKASYHRTWTDEETWEKSTAVSKLSALREVQGSSKTINVKVHRTDGGPVSFYQSVLQCGGMTFRYHKVYAIGSKEHQTGPQSTLVYEWRENQMQPVLHPFSFSPFNVQLNNNEESNGEYKEKKQGG